ncbi:MAG: hypothetical protein ACYDDO_06635 [Acidiferrobacterales bacterium]
MNHKSEIFRPIRHVLACALAAALFVSGLAPAFADGDSLKEGAKKAGHAAGSAVHDIGHGVKKAGKEIAHDAKKAGKEIGQAAKAGGREFKRALKGDKH